MNQKLFKFDNPHNLAKLILLLFMCTLLHFPQVSEVTAAGPVLISPANHSYTNDTTPFFDWNDYPSALEYHLQADIQVSFATAHEVYVTASEYQSPSPNFESRYYWRVRARLSASVWTDWSTVWDFIIDTTPPPAPTTPNPVDFGFSTEWRPILSWNDIPGVDDYQIIVDEYPPTGGLLVWTWISTNSFTFPFRPPDGDYVWQVLGRDFAGNTGSSSNLWWFTLDTSPPGQCVCTSPSNLEKLNNNTPELVWDVVGGFLPSYRYRIQVDNDIDFSSPLIDHTTTFDTPPRYQITSPLADDDYDWRVCAKDEAGNWGAWSAAYRFSLDTVPPGEPIPQTPSNNSFPTEDVVFLDWQAPSGSPTLYQVQVDDSQDFLNPIIDQSTSDEYLSTSISLEKKYFWRVRAKDEYNNWGNWSSTSEFTLDKTNPESPSSGSPITGTTINSNQPLLIWSSVSDAVEYWLQLDSTSVFGPPEVNITTTDSSYSILSTLGEGTYYWHVKARDQAGNWGKWSATWFFTVDMTGPGIPLLFSPGNNSILTDHYLELIWNPVAESHQYQLMVDNSKDFITPEINTTHSSTSLLVSLLADGTYFWRLRANDLLGNWGDWSNTWMFTITEPTTITQSTSTSVSSLTANSDSLTTQSTTSSSSSGVERVSILIGVIFLGIKYRFRRKRN